MKMKLLLFSILFPLSLTLLSLKDGTFDEQKPYSFIFPTQQTALTRDNVLTSVVEIENDSIATAIIYVPWDSTFVFSFPSKSEAQAVLENSLRTFPQQLVVKKIMVICTPYHFAPDTTASSYLFSEKLIAKKILMEDTAKAEYKALRRYDNQVRVEVSGWMPFPMRLEKKKSLCAGKYLSFSMHLLPGVNSILFELFSTSGNLLLKDSLRVFYQMDLSSLRVPTEFTRQVFHTKDNEMICVKCHSVDSQNSASELKCNTCHKGFGTQNFVHGPVSSDDCSGCHQDRTKGFVPTYSREEENQTCFACHENVQKDVSEKQFVHAPLVGEQCSICHSPHASSNPFQLRKSKNEICLSCHDNHREGNHPVMFHPNRDVPDPRNKDVMLSCVSCHDPHASENKSLLINSDGYFALCQSCHSK